MKASIDLLLRQHPDQVRDWLESVWSGKVAVSEGLNWLGLAEGSAFNAHSQLERGSTDAAAIWSYIAVSIYDYLASEADDLSKDSFEDSSMRLRASMIRKFGPIPGNLVLDLERVESWFFKRLTMKRDTAKEKSDHWRDYPIEDIRELRRIKNRLSVIELLVKGGYLTHNEDLCGWLSLKNRLP